MCVFASTHGNLVLEYCLLDYCMIDTEQCRMLSSSLSLSLLLKSHATSAPSRKRRIIAADDQSLAVAIIFAIKRLISHLFTVINDEMRLTRTCMRSCKSQDWNEFSRIQNPVVLLVKKYFMCRPIDTQDLEVDTRKPDFWCVEIEKPCVTSSDTANICCVRDTACPAKDETIFPCVAFFWRNYFCVDTACRR